MSTERSDASLIRIASVGIVVLLTAFMLAVNFQRLPLVGGGETYRAEFTDASGLVAGEEVRVAGIKVGQVTDIELGHARVIVTFVVRGVELGRQTTAGIEVKTLLGQHFLSVTPDGSGFLPENSTLPLSRTSTPVNIVPAFLRVTEQIQAIDTDQIIAAFDVLSEVLDKTAPELSGTLRGLSRLSTSVSSRDDQIRELFARTNQVSRVLADRDRDIAKLLTDTNKVLTMLDRRRKTISEIIDGTSDLAHQLSGLVKDNRAQLGPALSKLNGVIAILRKNERQLDELLKLTAVYAREFNNVGGSGRWFDASVKVSQGSALCSTGTDAAPAIGGVLDGILSQINQATNGSSQPCLPLGPAAGEAP
jgi:phospholipid/cholesterol/gamma-HCH transport system substrate-binding protein